MADEVNCLGYGIATGSMTSTTLVEISNDGILGSGSANGLKHLLR
jgi:hypothetical protein